MSALRGWKPGGRAKVAQPREPGMMAGVPEPFRHSVRVRYSECDLQGIVFNANYLTYVDDALTELWRAAVPGGYTGMVESGVDMVVGEANIRYLAPARVDDLLDLDVSVARLGHHRHDARGGDRV